MQIRTEQDCTWKQSMKDCINLLKDVSSLLGGLQKLHEGSRQDWRLDITLQFCQQFNIKLTTTSANINLSILEVNI